MFFLATQIFLWIAIAFVVGALLGGWYGRSSSYMLDDTSFTTRKNDSGGGSIKVLSDSLLESQRELKSCQQSLAVAESKLKDMELRFSKKKNNPSPLSPPVAVSEPDDPNDVPQIDENEADLLDDLTLIRGIGPYIQSKLREMNISSYRQIAHLTEEDINRIGEVINYFPGRIARDGWQESARALHEKKYGEMV